jgi:hypothetical protein
MRPPLRVCEMSRRSWLLAGLAAPLFRAWAADSVSVTFDGDNLHVVVPRLHFLAGKPLDRLMDGATVAFLEQVTIFGDNHGTVIRRLPDRLVFSYDLWEEKFSVSRFGSVPRSASRLSMAAAEAWCLEDLEISASGLAPNRPFWVRFELRTEDPKESSSVAANAGISIARLIEMFSRKPSAGEPYWTLEAGPLRVADLVRTYGRRT